MKKQNVFNESLFFLLLVIIYVLIGITTARVIIEMLHFAEKITPQTQSQITIGAVAFAMILAFFTRGLVKKWMHDFSETIKHTDRATVMSILLGIITGSVFAIPFALAFSKYIYIVLLITLLSQVFFSLIFYVKRYEAFKGVEVSTGEGDMCQPSYILDTSVLIDGRIVRLVENTDCLDGTIYIPDLVMNELRKIADSKEESSKRQRGRRGMEVVEKLRKLRPKKVIFIKTGRGKPVDEILIDEAKKRKGYLVTTDFNLEHTARPQGVKVINFNEIFYLLAPEVMPGDEIEVKLVKKGKEPYQGVGFLVDGTMVIVQAGEFHIGKTVRVRVQNVKQSQTGRILFATIIDEEEVGSA
ncbi:MAG: PIN domain nuclease [Dictyoglomi bacterium]|nr:PIN domain nuclease [Dictyoglomota bacterium]